MFPVNDQQYITNEPITQNESNVFNGKAFLYDYTTGDFVYRNGAPVLLEGPEALRAWMEKCIRTMQGIAIVHRGVAYGPKLDDLIGSALPKDFILPEIEREIREAFMRNPFITGIERFTFNLTDDLLTADIVVNSVYDEVVKLSI